MSQANDLLDLSNPGLEIQVAGYGRQPLEQLAKRGIIPCTIKNGKVLVTRGALEQFATQSGGEGLASSAAQPMGPVVVVLRDPRSAPR